MGKGTNKGGNKAAASTPAPAATAAPAAPAIAYKVGKVPNLGANTAQGNVATWQLLATALAAAPQTAAQLRTVAKARNHTSFVGYAIKNRWLVPSA